MARKITVLINTSTNLVSVQDYDSATGTIFNRIDGGFGEYVMKVTGDVDLGEDAATIALMHSSGQVFGEIQFTDIATVTINGVVVVIGDMTSFQGAVAPYFFNSGGSGYAFYKEMTLTSAMLLNDLDWDAGADPIVLLPAITNGYYSALRITHELDYGTVAYSVASKPGIYSHFPASGSATLLVEMSTPALNYAGDRVVPQIMPQMNNSNVMPIYGTGEQIIYKLANSGNQATGDGSVKLKIWYTPATFG